MKKYYFVCFIIVNYLNIIKCQGRVFQLNENKQHREINEKVYFRPKTNDNRFTSPLSKGFLSKKHSNRIDDDDESEDQVQSASDHVHVIILNANRANKPLYRTPDLNTVTDNRAISFIKHNLRNSNEEKDSDERKSTSLPSNRKNSSRPTHRIPPPSLMSSDSARSNLRVCEIKYAEYIQRIFPQETDTVTDANDEELNGRILAAPGQYPHMTALGFRASSGKIDYKCGGSLISENFVITAAHCTNITGLQPNKVRIGDLNLMLKESYLEPQIRSIRKIYVHPNYKRTSYYNDIALLELDQEVELTEYVRPIRLWTQETLPFSMAYAMGYGATDFARERTNRLTNLNMTIVPNEECNREMPKLPETENGILSSQICARDYALNRDTCQGDSGGPLQLNIRGRKKPNRLHYQLIGVTSYGLHCRSGYPSIFTRVCFYLDWIEHIVWRDYFK